MTTRRDYAISLGLAKPTRGRMSAEAWAAIAKAEKDGMVFTEKVSGGSVNANPLPAPVKETKEADFFDKYAPTPDVLRTGYLKFVKKNGGSLKVNCTEACEHCRVSFSYCHCGNSTFRFWKTGEVYTLVA